MANNTRKALFIRTPITLIILNKRRRLKRWRIFLRQIRCELHHHTYKYFKSTANLYVDHTVNVDV